MAELERALRESPVIAAARGREALLRAVRSPVRVVFVLGGDLFSLPDWVRIAREAGKLLFVHLDLVEGISRDAAGVRAVSRVARPNGVLSTRGPLLRAAAEEGLMRVLRVFMVDSSSMETGVRMANAAAPDLVEIMPGLVTRAIAEMGRRIAMPIIAGGMIESEAEARAARRAGALGVSTSGEALWESGICEAKQI